MEEVNSEQIEQPLSNPFPLDFEYLYGEPKSEGRFKVSCEDFNVVEDLGFELSGDGEHVCLWIQKIGENTQYLARQLAKFADIPARNVSYAGLKDRQGDTKQWFSLHIPGKITPDFSQFELEGVTILKTVRHHKKIKTGALDGNFFSIVLREISEVYVPIYEARLIGPKKKIAIIRIDAVRNKIL